MTSLLDALRSVYHETEPVATAAVAVVAEPVAVPTESAETAPAVPDGTVLCRIRVPLPAVRSAYDSLVDKPTGFIVVDAAGREVARFPPYIERAKQRFDRADFGVGCQLLRLPDRHLMAVKRSAGRTPFDDEDL